jgi:hypothetical protein
MAAAGARQIEYEFLGFDASKSSGLTTYTYSNEPLGDASADREIIGTFTFCRTSATAPAVSGVTIGGVSADIWVSDILTSTHSARACLFSANVPTGATGDVVVTVGTGCEGPVLALWRMSKHKSRTPNDTDSNVNTDTPRIISLDVPQGGLVVAAHSGVNNAGPTDSHTWNAGADEHYDQTPTTSGAPASSTAGSRIGVAASASHTITVTASPGGSGPRVLVGAAWR